MPVSALFDPISLAYRQPSGGPSLGWTDATMESAKRAFYERPFGLIFDEGRERQMLADEAKKRGVMLNMDLSLGPNDKSPNEKLVQQFRDRPELADFPQTREEFHDRVRERRAARERESAATVARSRGFGSGAAGFAGAMGGVLLGDPLAIPSAMATGGLVAAGTGVLRRAVVEGVTFGLAEFASLAQVAVADQRSLADAGISAAMTSGLGFTLPFMGAGARGLLNAVRPSLGRLTGRAYTAAARLEGLRHVLDTTPAATPEAAMVHTAEVEKAGAALRGQAVPEPPIVALSRPDFKPVIPKPLPDTAIARRVEGEVEYWTLSPLARAITAEEGRIVASAGATVRIKTVEGGTEVAVKRAGSYVQFILQSRPKAELLARQLLEAEEVLAARPHFQAFILSKLPEGVTPAEKAMAEAVRLAALKSVSRIAPMLEASAKANISPQNMLRDLVLTRLAAPETRKAIEGAMPEGLPAALAKVFGADEARRLVEAMAAYKIDPHQILLDMQDAKVVEAATREIAALDATFPAAAAGNDPMGYIDAVRSMLSKQGFKSADTDFIRYRMAALDPPTAELTETAARSRLDDFPDDAEILVTDLASGTERVQTIGALKKELVEDEEFMRAWQECFGSPGSMGVRAQT